MIVLIMGTIEFDTGDSDDDRDNVDGLNGNDDDDNQHGGSD